MTAGSAPGGGTPAEGTRPSPPGADPTAVPGGSPNVVDTGPARRLDRAGRIAIGVGVGLVVILALVRPTQLVIGTITGFVYGLTALGLVLVYKSSGVFNFAQGELGTVAIFATWLAHSQGLPYGAAMAAGVLSALAMGLATERLVIRPLADAPRVTVLVATAGVALLAIGAQFWLGGANIRVLDPALVEPRRISVLGVFISDQRLLIIAVTIVVGAALAWFFSRTLLGLAVVAASQEPVATELAGISVRRISTLVWGMTAVLGGVAGILFAPVNGTFTPGLMTSQALIPGFTAAVIGGMTSLPGAFLGGVIVGVGQSLGASGGLLPESVPGGGAVATFALLVAILSLRPQGLLGERS